MRKQLRHVAQSRLCLLTAHRTPEEADLMHFGTLKLILMEQVSLDLCHLTISFI